MDLWAQLIVSPEARATAAAILVTMLIPLVKPYLPTGEDADDPTKPTENRWIPVIHLLATLAICIGIAIPYQQNVIESAVLGAIASATATGLVRGSKLLMQGDSTERERASAVRKADAMEKKADRLEAKIDESDGTA